MIFSPLESSSSSKKVKSPCHEGGLGGASLWEALGSEGMSEGEGEENPVAVECSFFVAAELCVETRFLYKGSVVCRNPFLV